MDLKQKMTDSLRYAFMGDALAMPVHWYYNLDNIIKDYGGNLTGLVRPVDIQSGGGLNS